MDDCSHAYMFRRGSTAPARGSAGSCRHSLSLAAHCRTLSSTRSCATRTGCGCPRRRCPRTRWPTRTSSSRSTSATSCTTAGSTASTSGGSGSRRCWRSAPRSSAASRPELLERSARPRAPSAPEELDVALRELDAADDAPSLSTYLEREGDARAAAASSSCTAPPTSSRRPTRTRGRSRGCAARRRPRWSRSRPTSTAAAAPQAQGRPSCPRSQSFDQFLHNAQDSEDRKGQHDV